jgi:FkbM family methyltransferase
MLASYRDQLKVLMSETAEACRSRERNAFDEITEGNPRIILFGAGGLGRKVLTAFREDGIEPLAFVDNKLKGQTVEGLNVLAPAEAVEDWGQSAVFVVTIWAAWADTMQEQIQSLRKLGCKNVITFIPVLWKYPRLLPHVQVDLPSRVLAQKDQVLEAFDLWSDDDSRGEFVAQLRWRLLGDFNGLSKLKPDPYWQDDIVRLKHDTVFVDAGAFDGDTFAQFIEFSRGEFRAAYLFEPDSRNLRSLEKRLGKMPEEIRNRVHVFASAVAEDEYDVSFQGGSGPSSAPGAGCEVVHCVSLDHSLPEAPGLIKYDIEGFELLALNGSRRIIKDNKPVLAVCAYHIQDHIWQIPLLIASIRTGYRFYLRPHGQIWETVCYAVP